MAWEGLLPAALIGGALIAASVGLDVTQRLGNEVQAFFFFFFLLVLIARFCKGRPKRINRDAFDVGLDAREKRLVQEGVLKRGKVHGVNEELLFAKQ